jgi:hypothetical protein
LKYRQKKKKRELGSQALVKGKRGLESDDNEEMIES